MSQQVVTIENAWRKYQQQLLWFIHTNVETKEDAEELLNDVFVKLAKTIADNNAPDNISAWLYRVTKNQLKTVGLTAIFYSPPPLFFAVLYDKHHFLVYKTAK